MTQSIPAPLNTTSDSTARQQRLMELIAAEDAANGDVGCGHNPKTRLLANLDIREVVREEGKLRTLLRVHLGHCLREPDFDSITDQIQHHLEALTVQPLDTSGKGRSPSDSAPIPDYLPREELRELFQSHLSQGCAPDALEYLMQSSQQIIHNAVLHPRHTWAAPIWVLKGDTQIYIAQAAGLKEAIAKVKSQHPQEAGELAVVTVGGILAPDPVISLDVNRLFT